MFKISGNKQRKTLLDRIIPKNGLDESILK